MNLIEKILMKLNIKEVLPSEIMIIKTMINQIFIQDILSVQKCTVIVRVLFLKLNQK